MDDVKFFYFYEDPACIKQACLLEFPLSSGRLAVLSATLEKIPSMHVISHELTSSRGTFHVPTKFQWDPIELNLRENPLEVRFSISEIQEIKEWIENPNLYENAFVPPAKKDIKIKIYNECEEVIRSFSTRGSWVRRHVRIERSSFCFDLEVEVDSCILER